MLGTVITNYLAQIPYYVHQYYAPHKFLPSLFGTVLLGTTFVWFMVAYIKLTKQQKTGYYLMITFLAVEFLFYLQTQISQYLISHRILLHVYHPDSALLFAVFGIGYINFVASAYFLIYLVKNKQSF